MLQLLNDEAAKLELAIRLVHHNVFNVAHQSVGMHKLALHKANCRECQSAVMIVHCSSGRDALLGFVFNDDGKVFVIVRTEVREAI